MSAVERADGTREPILSNVRFELAPGERFTSANPGGGGCGDPFARPVSQVLADVLDGYVSIEAAEIEYGVVVRPGEARELEVDPEATNALREMQT